MRFGCFIYNVVMVEYSDARTHYLPCFSNAPEDVTVMQVVVEKLDVDAEIKVYVSITCTPLSYRTDSKMSHSWPLWICCVDCKNNWITYLCQSPSVSEYRGRASFARNAIIFSRIPWCTYSLVLHARNQTTWTTLFYIYSRDTKRLHIMAPARGKGMAAVSLAL